MKVKADELILDGYVSPRQSKSNKTVEAYVEAMKAGAEFPLIEVQRVSKYPKHNEDVVIVIDGYHRLIAYQELSKLKDFKGLVNINELEVQEFCEDVLDYESNKIRLALVAAERNTQHGDRLDESDKKAKVTQIAQDDGDITEEILSKSFCVSMGRISGWISPIRQRQRASRDSSIIKLSRLGWTQQEIADVLQVTHQRISQIANNFSSEKICNLLSEGRDMAYVADAMSMDLALTWALYLEGKSDKEKFGGNDNGNGTLGWGLRTWDLWNFNDCDGRFGDEWPGRIPAQLVAHTLFYFTKKGDLVLDPMAGGGVVPDVCLAFERKCRAFDIVVRKSRPEIQEHYWELGNMRWPNIKKPDLIFFDPPYFTKKQADYREKAGEHIPVSSLDRNKYLDFFREFFVLAHENSKTTTRISFLNADWRDFQSTPADKENSDAAITIFDYHALLQETGWKVTHRIECPMSTQRFKEGIVNAMQDSRILGTVGRTLLVARKDKE